MQVFKIMWPEPTSGSQVLLSMVAQDGHNSPFDITRLYSPFFVQIRRFVVVATDVGHSTCVYVAPLPPRNWIAQMLADTIPHADQF